VNKDIKNLTASIRARLQNKAKETDRSFSEILQYYGMERFLYRFSQSQYAEKFILKGALMFTVWEIPERRTTLDIDFSAEYDNHVDAIEKVIKNICHIPVTADGLVFDAKTVKGQKITENAEYGGVRVKFTGFLERSRIPMQIDVGFGDVIYPKFHTIDYPVILEFPVIRLKGYPVESVVSEKFEAMVKLGLLNSRMKDFYDVWIMMRQFNFNGSRLAEAIKRTFNHRKTPIPLNKPLFAEEIYDEKSDRQTLWQAFLKKENIKHAPEKLSDTAGGIEKFLIRPLKAINKNEKFDELWIAPGPWKMISEKRD
jgi:predicted nucleotidyltransferase component of viral defense system